MHTVGSGSHFTSSVTPFSGNLSGALIAAAILLSSSAVKSTVDGSLEDEVKALVAAEAETDSGAAVLPQSFRNSSAKNPAIEQI